MCFASGGPNKAVGHIRPWPQPEVTHDLKAGLICPSPQQGVGSLLAEDAAAQTS